MLWSRKKKNPLPWNSLPPERVTTFTAPPAPTPVDRSKFTLETWNSWTISCEKFCCVPPVTESRTVAPSTVMRVRLESAPRMETSKARLY